MPGIESRTCRSCAGPLRKAFEAREMHFGTREVFGYLECEKCAALQISKIPADLERFYPPEYYTQQSTHGTQRAQSRIAPLRRLWTRCRLRPGVAGWPWAGRRYGRFEWFARTSTGVDDPVLEVGCGSGRLLTRLSREGFRDLQGIDPKLPMTPKSEGNPRFAQVGLDEHAGTYHLVMAHHSFEHLPDPRAAFRAFAACVKPGGWLLLRVPLADSWARRHYGADWVQLDAPRHLHIPTRKSVERLAREFGFRVTRIVDDSGPFQIWGSEFYRSDRPLVPAGSGPGRKKLGWRTRLFSRLRARRLRAGGLGDQACFYLQRLS